MLRHEHPARWYAVTTASTVLLFGLSLLLLFTVVPPAQAAANLVLSVKNHADNSVGLSWALVLPPGVSLRSYQVRYGVYGSPTVYTKSTYRLPYTNITGLLPGTTYWFQVKANTTIGYISSNTLTQKTDGGEPLPPTPPADPTNLVADAVSANSIELHWTDSASNEQGFLIQQADSATGQYVQVASAGADQTSYTVDGLPELVTRYFRVCAYNADGNSAFSNTAFATTPATIPIAPSNLAATVVSASQIDLTWVDKSFNETGFLVEHATALTGPFTPVASLGPGVTSCSDAGLLENTTYYYRVSAGNSAGGSGYATVSAKTPATVPIAPSNLVATAVSTTRIDLQWGDNSFNETGFSIERAPTAGGTFAQIATVNPGVTTYASINLVAATPYYYRVRAYNSAGNSAFSNTASATTKVAVPTAPSNLTASPASANAVDLTWVDNSSNDTSFKIERALGSTGSFSLIDTVGAGVTSYSNTGLSASTTYQYRVCANNAAGNSAYSNTATATTPAPPPTAPAAPGGLTATAIAADKIDLRWTDNSSNESGFRVERGPSPAGPFAQIATPGAGVIVYSDSGLSASTTYYYRVYAWNGVGPSAYTDIASATTLGTAPIAPSNLAATVVSTTRIDLSWSESSSNESGFKVLRTDPASKVVTYVLPPNATSYSDTGLTASTTYSYQVCAYNAIGSSAYAGPVNATTNALPPAPPTAPDSPAAVAVSYGEIRLSWRDTAWNETAFIVESSAYATYGFAEKARPASNTETYSDQGLAEGTTRYYRVCATNDGGKSAYTAAVSATTKLKPPTNLSATATGPNSISLAWIDNSIREANYIVERSTEGASGPWSTVATLAANSISYADQTCQPLTSYSYRVRASGSTSDYSNVETIVTPDMPIQPQWVGKTPVIGDAYWVAMAGSYAYVTSSTGLQVVDVSDPSKPLVTGSVDISYPYDVAASGDGFAYVCSSKSLKIVDLQDPASPEVVATLQMPDYAQGVSVSANKAYVACYTAGLVIVDITVPTAPLILKTVDTPGVAFSVAVIGSKAVVADNSSIVMIDVADPTSASVVGSMATSDRAVDVDIQGSYAYVAASSAGVLVLDIDNLAGAQLVGTGTPTTFGAASGIDVFGNHALVASSSYNTTDNGLQVVDISDPAQPRQESFLEVVGRTRGGIAVNGDLVCFASGVGGLVSIRVADPSRPVCLDQMPATMQSPSLAFEGSYLYTLSYSSVQSRMYVYDVSTPEFPVQISNLDLSYPLDIALDGNGHAFIADYRSLKVVDIQDPTAPVLLATLDLPDYAWGVCVSGSKVYVACYTAGLVIVDIGNPYAPRIAGSVNTPGVAFAVAVAGNTAVVADATAVLTIDVANPASPSIIGSLATAGQATDVQIANGYAYVAANNAGMLVLDIKQPGGAQLACAGVPTMLGAPSGIEVSGSRVFAASFSSAYTDNGLQIFDISNPVRPIQSAYLLSPGRYRKAVAVAGRTIFLTDDKYLVRIAQF